MFVQNEEEAKEVQNTGFHNVEVLTKDTVFEGIQLVKTRGEHGRGEELLKRMGKYVALSLNIQVKKHCT